MTDKQDTSPPAAKKNSPLPISPEDQAKIDAIQQEINAIELAAKKAELAKQMQIEGLYPEQRDAYNEFAKKIERLKNTHPNYEPEAVEALDGKLAFKLYEFRESNKRNDAAIRNPNVTTKKQYLVEEKKFKDEMRNEWLKKEKSYGLNGARALADLESEINPGVIGGIIKNVYDKNNNGPQWGGILGALGGVLLGYLLGGEKLGGGWMSIVAVIGGALLGSWLGNKAGNAVSELFSDQTQNKNLDIEKARQRSRGGDDSPERQEAAAEAERVTRAREEVAKTRQDLQNSVYGTYGPPQTATYDINGEIQTPNVPAKPKSPEKK